MSSDQNLEDTQSIGQSPMGPSGSFLPRLRFMMLVVCCSVMPFWDMPMTMCGCWRTRDSDAHSKVLGLTAHFGAVSLVSCAIHPISPSQGDIVNPFKKGKATWKFQSRGLQTSIGFSGFRSHVQCDHCHLVNRILTPDLWSELSEGPKSKDTKTWLLHKGHQIGSLRAKAGSP